MPVYPFLLAHDPFYRHGRRSGKDSAASIIATFMAMTFKPQEAKLRPGERATVACLACDRDQANIVRKYIAGLVSEDLFGPWMAEPSWGHYTKVL
jgi:hypothetical protein